ncbi:hypothetical protein TNCV_4788511 [Trichonephila clavipes]|nr:hypothetical protein TNCV_4788511 [Trichonephila clavipes]
MKEQHIAHLHAGPTLLAHVLRQSHWIVGSRKLINKCIRKCLKSNKFKVSTTTPQLMGNFPKHRVTLERPFFSSKGTSFNLQPQRSLRVATEYQTWLLEAVLLRLPVFLTTSKEMAGRTKLKEDDILLIQEEGPPGTWAMSRVLQVHAGNDGLVRVATVKTQESVFKRPVHKLRKFPIYPN